MSDPTIPSGTPTPPPPQPQRAASVTLRSETGTDDSAVQLDAANQSLAEALNLVFGGIKLAMLGLVVYFIFSGVQMVKETESGIRLLFGRVTGDNISSGPQFAWPYPLGELIRVDTGARTLELEDSFMPSMTADQKKLPLSQVAQQGVKLSLKPGEDGSLITGDAALAHAKWRVLYRRHRPRDFVANVYEEHEKKIVQAAVEQAVVKSVATMTIDDLLKQSSGEPGSVATRAKELAQECLDRLGSGIQIEQLTLQDKCQPFATFAEFNGVQSAEQKASEQISNARSTSQNILNAMAGAAAQPLITMIDRYEAAIEQKDADAQRRALDTVHALMRGERVAVDDVVYDKAVSGTVTSMLNDANQYRTSIVSQRRGELASFQAKLEQFRSNPDVVIQREWADALSTLLARGFVESFVLPEGTRTVELNINRDQEFVKLMQQLEIETRAKKAEEARRKAQEAERLRVPTDHLELNAIPKAGSR
ncbi:MAG: hypothetical protein KF678_04955 [Phycisphaeraceae bacterium]|nr:hypothetical protein [Phycisphaeraceae bacterium]